MDAQPQQVGILQGEEMQHDEISPEDMPNFETEINLLSNSGILRGPDGQALRFIAVSRNGQHEYIDRSMLSPEYINSQLANGNFRNIATTNQTIAAAQHNQEQLLAQTTVIDEQYVQQDMMNHPKEVVQLVSNVETQYVSPSTTTNSKMSPVTSNQMPALTPISRMSSRALKKKSPEVPSYENEEECEDDSSSKAKKKRTATTTSTNLPHKKRLATTPIQAKQTKIADLETKPLVVKKSAGIKVPKVEFETYFSCEICLTSCGTQLEFFRHLKLHYEPTTLMPATVVTKVNVDHIQSSPPSPPAFERSKRIRKPSVRAQQAVETTQIVSSSQTKINTPEDVQPTSVQELLEQFPIEEDPADDSVDDSDYKPDDDDGQMDLMNEFSDSEDMLDGIRGAVDKVQESVDHDLDEEIDQKHDWFDGQLNEEIHFAGGNEMTDPESPEVNQTIKKEVVSDSGDETKPEQPVAAKKRIKRPPTAASKLMYIEERDETNKTGKRGKGKKSFKCTICEKVCNSKNSLHYHFLSHTGERPHTCTECGKGFMANSALKVHMRLHTGDKPYSCEVCSRAFRQWGDLKYHMTSLHSEEKNHQCEFCGKDFARRYSLVIHRRIHTGERNYKCEYCGKTFRASTYLQDHRRIHTGEKPHDCEYCGKKFRVRGDLKRHWNIHTRGLMPVTGEKKPIAVEPDFDEVAAAIQIIDDGNGGFTVKNEDDSHMTMINGILVDTVALAKKAIKRSKPKPKFR